MVVCDGGPTDVQWQLNSMAVNRSANRRSGAEVFQRSLKERAAVELLSQFVFRPLAHVVVLVLLPVGFAPTALVTLHSLLGLACGVLISQQRFLLAAILIQLKTVLDGADGQLARASGKVTETGRYADTEGDLLVNAALFAGIGWVTGGWVLAIVGFLSLTLVLSTDFNAEWMYRRARGIAEPPPIDSTSEHQGLLRLLTKLYSLIFSPQDRWIRIFSEHRLTVAAGIDTQSDPLNKLRIAYNDRSSLSVLANFGLATQLAVLGVCLAAGKPSWFAWFTLLCALMLIPLQFRREFLVRSLSQRVEVRP
jgi:archaetidylinositol phosphate synthase